MKTIQLECFSTNSNYCAAYNDCAPSKLLRHTSAQNFVEPSQSIVGESHVLDKAKPFLHCVSDFEMREPPDAQRMNNLNQIKFSCSTAIKKV